jgi:hypothetical protein
MNHYHSRVEVDGVPVDILLTETEIKSASERALNNPEQCCFGDGCCWPIDCPQTKCSLLKWIMGKCCECGECDD